MSLKNQPECQAEACALQACLGKNTYKPELCDAYVRKLYLCCQKMYEETEEKGKSTACPIPNVIERWLKNHPESDQFP